MSEIKEYVNSPILIYAKSKRTEEIFHIGTTREDYESYQNGEEFYSLETCISLAKYIDHESLFIELEKNEEFAIYFNFKNGETFLVDGTIKLYSDESVIINLEKEWELIRKSNQKESST